MTEVFKFGGTGKMIQRRSAVTFNKITANNLNDIAKGVVVQMKQLTFRIIFNICHKVYPHDGKREQVSATASALW